MFTVLGYEFAPITKNNIPFDDSTNNYYEQWLNYLKATEEAIKQANIQIDPDTYTMILTTGKAHTAKNAKYIFEFVNVSTTFKPLTQDKLPLSFKFTSDLDRDTLCKYIHDNFKAIKYMANGRDFMNIDIYIMFYQGVATGLYIIGYPQLVNDCVRTIPDGKLDIDHFVVYTYTARPLQTYIQTEANQLKFYNGVAIRMLKYIKNKVNRMKSLHVYDDSKAYNLLVSFRYNIKEYRTSVEYIRKTSIDKEEDIPLFESELFNDDTDSELQYSDHAVKKLSKLLIATSYAEHYGVRDANGEAHLQFNITVINKKIAITSLTPKDWTDLNYVLPNIQAAEIARSHFLSSKY